MTKLQDARPRYPDMAVIPDPLKEVDPNAYQIGGVHYKGDYQHWDYATDTCMRHLEGAATKYMARFGNKPGESAVKDLEKALHYLEKLLAVYRESRIASLFDIQGSSFDAETPTARFIANLQGYAIKPRTMAALILLSRWGNADMLEEARNLVAMQLAYEKDLPQAAPRV